MSTEMCGFDSIDAVSRCIPAAGLSAFLPVQSYGSDLRLRLVWIRSRHASAMAAMGLKSVLGWGHCVAAVVVHGLLGAATPVSANTVRAQFGVQLVIAPACDNNAAPQVDDKGAAVALASSVLQVSHLDLSADHDLRDTGYWLVLREQKVVLRIEKCSGAVSLLEPPPQNAPSLGEQGAIHTRALSE